VRVCDHGGVDRELRDPEYLYPSLLCFSPGGGSDVAGISAAAARGARTAG
jgi:hypothetical protein